MHGRKVYAVCFAFWLFSFGIRVSCSLYTLHGAAHKETSSTAGFSVFCVRLYHIRCTQCNISHAVAAVLCSAALGLVLTAPVSSSWQGLCTLLLQHLLLRRCWQWVTITCMLQMHASRRAQALRQIVFPWCDLNNARTWW